MPRKSGRVPAQAGEAFARRFRLTLADRVRFLAGAAGVSRGLLLGGTALATSLSVFAPSPARAQALVVQGGTTYQAPTPDPGGTFTSVTVGNAGSGTLIVDTGGSIVATDNVSLVIGGAAGGQGTVQLNGGSISIANGLFGSADTGTYTQSGGILTATGQVLVGQNAAGTVTLNGGTFNAAQGTIISNGSAAGVGTFTNAGGAHTTSFIRLGQGAVATATYNLNGGTTTTQAVDTNDAAATSTFNFNGGTLRASTSTTGFMQGLTAANVQAGGAIIDTNGVNVTIGQALLHDAALGATADGGLTKSGAGTLTLTGANTYTGGTTIGAGTLSVGADGNLGATTGGVTFGGGTLATTAGFTLAAGRAVAIGAGGGTFAPATGTVLQINGAGQITGTGLLTKAGLGTLTIGGANAGFSGGVALTSGVLEIQNTGALGSGATTFTGGTLALNIAGANGAAVPNDLIIAAGQTGTIANVLTGEVNRVTVGGGGSSYAGNLRFGTATATGIVVFSPNGGASPGQQIFVDFGTLRAGSTALSVLTSIAPGATTVAAGATLDYAGTAGTINNLQGGGTVRQDGGTLTVRAGSFSGIIQNGATPVALTKDTAGTLTLSGANTYTGATTIQNGGTLALSGAGSIAASSGVALQTGSTFDISVHTGGATITSLSSTVAGQTGTVTLGANTLTLSNAAGSFAGAIGGTGGLILSAGTETLTGTNGYTGATTLNGGATLNVTGAGTLATSGVTVNQGTLLVDGGAFTGNTGVSLTATTGNATFTVNGSETLGTGALSLSRTGVLTSTVDIAAGAVTLTAATVTANAGTTINIGAGSTLTAATITTNTGSTINVGAGSTLQGTGNTINNGGATVVAAGGTVADIGAINNTGTYTFQGSATFNSDSDNTDAAGTAVPPERINNAGLIELTGGAGTTVNVAPGGAVGNNDLFNDTAGTITTGAATLTGIATLTNNSTTATGIAVGAGGTLTAGALAGTVATSVLSVGTGGALNINGAQTTTYAGLITGTGAVNRSGTGTTTLTGTNAAGAQFTGTATVTGGTLLVGDGTSGRFGNTAGPAVGQTLTVGTAGTLGGTGNGTTTGRIDLLTTIGNGGTLSAGTIASAGTLTFGTGTSLTTNAGSNTLFNLVTPNVLGSATNDLVNVVGALNVTGGTLTLRNAENTAAPANNGIYRLFTVGSGGGTASTNFTLNDPANQRLITTATTVDVRIGATPRIQFFDGADTGAGAQGGAGTFAPGVIAWVDDPATSVFRDSFQGGEGVFGTAGGAVTVTGANSFQRLDFEVAGYTLAGAGTLNLTQDTDLATGAGSRTAANLATPAVTAGLTALGTISVSTGVTAVVNSALTSTVGQVGLVKIGDGTLQLGATNTYTGDTRVAAGTLQLATGTDRIRDFATGVATGRVLIDNNATARLLVSTSETIGSLESVAQPAAPVGTPDAQGRVEITGPAVLTTGARPVNTVFAGQVTGTGGLTTAGTNVFTLSGTNTAAGNYTGAVNVGNVLRVTGRFGDVDGAITSTVTVGNAGTLQGAGNGGSTFPATATTTGRVDANVTIATGGTLSPGLNAAGGEAANGTVGNPNSAAGTLVIGGTLALAAGSTSVFDLSAAAGVRNNTSDLVVVNGNLTVAAGANVTLQGSPVSGVYRLFDAAAVDANFTSVTVNPAGAFGAVTYLAANNTAPGTQVNARINVAGQIVQFWDGPDNLGVTATSNANAGAGGGTGPWNQGAGANTNWTIEGANTGTGTGTPGSASGGDVNDSWQSQVGVFAGAQGTVTIGGGGVSAQGLQFITNGYIVQGGPLTLLGDTPGGDAGHTFFNVDTGSTATINSPINGAAGLRMRVGGGTLQLGGASTYTGETLVDAGTLTVLAGGSIVGTSNVTNNANLGINAGGTVTTAGAVVNNGAFGVGGTLNAGSITNNNTFTLAGGGTATAATVTNNATFTSGGTLNATASLTNAAAGTFNLTTGTTTTPSATNAGTFNHLGGTLAATTFTNAAGGTYTEAAGATLAAGTVTNNGTFTSAGTVTATGSFTNNGVLAASTPITTPTFTNTAVVNGQLTLAGNTNATNTASGTIPGGIAIAAAAGGATFANAGTTGAGAGLAFSNIGGTLTVNNTGVLNGFANSVAGSTTVINNAATWNYAGTSPLGGNDTVNNTGAFNVVANSAINGLETFNNQGAGRTTLTAGNLTGSIATFNNTGGNGNGGGVFLEGRSLSGIGTFNNNGFLQSVPVSGAAPTSAFLGATTFNNQANGVISLVNGRPVDQLTLGGNYNGTAGSQLRVDVNLNQAFRQSDLLVINGQNNGVTTLVLNRLDPANTALFSATPIQVVQANGGGGGQVVLSQPIQGNGFTTFELISNAPGSYQIVSRLNTASAAGTTGSISALITSLNVGFFQSVSAFIGAPNPNNNPDDCQSAGSRNNPNCTTTASVSTNNMTWAQLNSAAAAQSEPAPAPGITPNTISGGLWARGVTGDFTVRATNTAVFGATRTSSPSRVENGFAGMQVGIDGGLFNIDNTGWNVHVGVTGGEVFAQGQQKIGSDTRGTFNVPFVGFYTALTNGPFFSDLSYRHDFYDSRFSDTLAGLNQQKINIGSNTVSGSTGYRFDFESLFGTELPYFIEPSASMSYTNTFVGAFPVIGGSLKIDNIESIIGRFGVRFGTAFQATDQIALQPFVTFSVLNEFAGDVRTRFITTPTPLVASSEVPILTNRVGTFGQIGVGSSFQILDTPIIGYIRSDFRFGDRLEGYAVNGGLRYQF